MYKMQHAITLTNATHANAMFANMQTQFANTKCKVKIVLQSNNFYCITVTRKFKSYKKAVKQFNKTVQQFCNTAAQHTCTEDHVPSCYVLHNKQAVY